MKVYVYMYMYMYMYMYLWRCLKIGLLLQEWASVLATVDIFVAQRAAIRKASIDCAQGREVLSCT